MGGEGNKGGEVLSPSTRLLLMGGSILSALRFSTLERSEPWIDFSTMDRSKPRRDPMRHRDSVPWTGPAMPPFLLLLPATDQPYTVAPT